MITTNSDTFEDQSPKERVQANTPQANHVENIPKGDINSDELQQVIESYTKYYSGVKRTNQTHSIILGGLGITLSLLATISGIYGEGKLSAIFAAGSASTQALLYAYPVEKRASLYRLLRIECSSLEEEIQVTQDPTQEQLQEILKKFQGIKLKAADEDSERTLAEASKYYQKRLNSLDKKSD